MRAVLYDRRRVRAAQRVLAAVIAHLVIVHCNNYTSPALLVVRKT